MANSRVFDALACPVCKGPLRRTHCQESASGVVKHGALYCPQCQNHVATIRHGKPDFLRVDVPLPLTETSSCDEFHYKRLPWDHKSVVAKHCSRADIGWNSEGFAGCLLAGPTPDWSICIDTNATDLALRFLSHEWSSSVSVTVDDGPAITIDLYSADSFSVTAYQIFRNLSGNKKITVRGAPPNPLSKGNAVYFFGMDAVFSGELAFTGGNRGNGFPPAYEWVLGYLEPNALVLDCGSGDRKYPDERVVSFEYMPFEFPDVFGDGHALPFLDGTFDAVFSQAVMEHMRDPYLAAREIARVLKPGGIVYVESAFMQPLHAVPFHFFNTTVWGIEAIFEDAGVIKEASEWFGPISASLDWYLNACGGGGLNPKEREQLRRLFQKVDSNVSYEQLKPVASAVAFWGTNTNAPSPWKELLGAPGRPSFKYGDAVGSRETEIDPLYSFSKRSFVGSAYRHLRSVVKTVIGTVRG